MILRFLFFTFIAYLLYKFVFEFLWPVYKATRKMRAGLREMSARMNQQDVHERMQQQTHKASQNGQQQKPAPTKGEYIDFEELKD